MHYPLYNCLTEPLQNYAISKTEHYVLISSPETDD